MACLAVLAAVAVVVLVAVVDADSYYAAVENRLPAVDGMELACRPLGGRFITNYSVVPRGRVPRGGRRVVELLVEPDLNGSVLCSWSYQGNYVANMRLLDSRWLEAKRCKDPATGICRIVFEDDWVHFETVDGGRRVIGDLPVKHCQQHWLLFSTGCSYPDHPNPYAGRRLGNAFEYFGV